MFLISAAANTVGLRISNSQNHFFGSFGFAAPAFSHLPSAVIRAFAISNYFPFLLIIRNSGIQRTVIRRDKEVKSNTFVRVLLVCASSLRVKSVPIQRHFFSFRSQKAR